MAGIGLKQKKKQDWGKLSVGFGKKPWSQQINKWIFFLVAINKMTKGSQS